MAVFRILKTGLVFILIGALVQTGGLWAQNPADGPVDEKGGEDEPKVGIIKKKPGKRRLRRLHIYYGKGAYQSGIENDLERIISDWGFGEKYILYFGPLKNQIYPEASMLEKKYNLRIEYAIKKKLSVGISYSNLGQFVCEGFTYTDSKMGKIFLNEEFSCNAFYLTVARRSGRRNEFKKSSLYAGAGLGISAIHQQIGQGADSRYQYEPQIDTTKLTPCAMVYAGYDYYIWSWISIGIGLNYNYVPYKIDSFTLKFTYNLPGRPYTERGNTEKEYFFSGKLINFGGLHVSFLHIGLHF